MKAPNPAEVMQLGNSLFAKIQPKVTALFDEGNPVCLYSTGTVADALQRKGWPFYVASGELNDGGHWFPVVETTDGPYVIDLGDNCSDEALETGIINPVVIPLNGSGYTVEDKMSYKQFKEGNL